MSTYVTSDIHGEYEMFMELMDKIGLKDSDTLYINGDILDRGANPMKTLLEIMRMKNVVCLAGNHELMAMECLGFLMNEITEESLKMMDENVMGNLITWQYNGGATTMREFHNLSREDKLRVIDFLGEFHIYRELEVGGRKYLIVHAGLGNFRQDKKMEEYSLKELVWDRADYDRQYFSDVTVITGHTPTQFIMGNPLPGHVFRKNNHMAIDCGSYRLNGRLAAVCLDTGREYYSSDNSFWHRR